ncbi:MAG: hypothetical protein MJ215_05960 [Spirochaetia bacterium]|nr:hypothetical protein [Spirochaetia bacterium]
MDNLIGYYLNIGTIYVLVGFAMTLILYYAYKKDFFGNFWTVLIIAVIGSFLGAIIEYIFHDLIVLMTKISGSINIFPPIVISWLVIYIYHKVSSRNDRDE